VSARRRGYRGGRRPSPPTRTQRGVLRQTGAARQLWTGGRDRNDSAATRVKLPVTWVRCRSSRSARGGRPAPFPADQFADAAHAEDAQLTRGCGDHPDVDRRGSPTAPPRAAGRRRRRPALRSSRSARRPRDGPGRRRDSSSPSTSAAAAAIREHSAEARGRPPCPCAGRRCGENADREAASCGRWGDPRLGEHGTGGRPRPCWISPSGTDPAAAAGAS
jgi:hypothetical protein